MRTLCLLIAAVAYWGYGCEPAGEFGTFEGEIAVKFCADGRRMELTEQAQYHDPNGTVWVAPKGAVIDGASIPQAAWPIIGGPFEGKYRTASVFHDVACVERKKPWQDTARMFYNAMRASGVDEVKAKAMFGAVYHFGPRWTLPADPNPLPPCGVTVKRLYSLNAAAMQAQQEKIKRFVARIEKENPSLEDIERMSRE